MNWFRAIVHTMTTVSAGGFANYDASFGAEQLNQAMPAAIVFMFIAGLPFSLLSIAILQGRLMPMLRDPQPRLYLGLAVFFTVAIVGWHEAVVDPPIFNNVLHGSTEAFFNIISIMTGTGYASAPYDTWGEPPAAIFLVATFVGGCAGSAACKAQVWRCSKRHFPDTNAFPSCVSNDAYRSFNIGKYTESSSKA